MRGHIIFNENLMETILIILSGALTLWTVCVKEAKYGRTSMA